MRAKGPRGQDLQGTVEIRRDLRHLWPVRPSDALLHSKPTCPHAHVVASPVAPPAPSSPAFSAPPTGGSGSNITTGAYGYGGGDGSNGGGAYGRGYGDGSYGGGAYGYGDSDGGYSDGAYSGPYDHGGHGGAGYEAVQLDSRLAAAAAVMIYHHGRRQHLIAATTDLYSRQATEETASPLRLRAGATRMKDISVVLFPPFLVARNRVLAPLLMSCSSQLPSRVSFPTSCLRFSRRNVLALQP